MTSEDIHLHITYFSAGDHELISALLLALPCTQQCYAEPGSYVFKTSPGVIMQFCNAAAQPPAFLTIAPQPVISFKVKNLAAAMETALSQNATLLQHDTDTCTGLSRCYLRLTDHSVIGFFQLNR